MTLKDAETDKKYKIKQIAGDLFLHRRLLDMGFTPNTDVFLMTKAPLKDTFLVGIRGIFIALREDAAKLIQLI